MPPLHRSARLGLFLTGLIGITLFALQARAKSLSSSSPHSPITTASLGWLAGTWRGTVTGGQLSAELMYTPPAAGTIVGAVRITKGSDLAVIELVSFIDTPHGVELRFRHFGGDLTAYEPDFQQNMALTAASDSDVTFTNTVAYNAARMSTQPRVTRFIRRGADDFVGRSDIIGADGKPAVIESVYRRAR
jgi:Domain of unknown function (DUF6265)